MKNSPLLEVKNLSVSLVSDTDFSKKTNIQIIDDISFHINKGEIFGIVGESGCGKSITALSLIQLLSSVNGQIDKGSILFENQDISQLKEEQKQGIRGKEIAMIFQEPASAFNPLIPLGKQVLEIYNLHAIPPNQKHINDLLKKMGLSDVDRVLSSYPHELSGGMLQRIMIVCALLLRPKLIIADEPTTALDVTVQAQIMELLKENKQECSILLISHNLGLMAQYTDRIAIMYAGRLCEEGLTEDFFKDPKHPYSLALLKAFPDIEGQERIETIGGQVLLPQDYQEACRFLNRCESKFEPCYQKPKYSTLRKNKKVACFLFDKESVNEL